jgi:hypothetical protein
MTFYIIVLGHFRGFLGFNLLLHEKTSKKISIWTNYRKTITSSGDIVSLAFENAFF